MQEKPKQEQGLAERTPNTAMLILECIGIIAVVWGHGGKEIPNVTNMIFPYYSWHMPFFIFISGYFFNRSLPCGKFLRKKARTLLVPALLANLICGIFSVCLEEFGVTKYGQALSLRALLVEPFLSGYQFRINVSLWFIFQLLVVECISVVLDRLAKGKGELLFTALFGVLALYCCWVSQKSNVTEHSYLYAPLRTGYMTFFFWLGMCYKSRWESRIKKYITLRTSLIVALAQALLLWITGAEIIYNVRIMKLYPLSAFWSPMITPITALVFFLGIAYALEPALRGKKLIACIGMNTRFIVYYHQLFFVLITGFLAVLMRKFDSFGLFQSFSNYSRRTDIYYTGGTEPITQFLVTALSLALPLIVGVFISRRRCWWHKALWSLGCVGLIVAYLFGVGWYLSAG